MRAGVREWIAAPADEGPLNATIERIRAELQDLGAAGVAPSELVAFLPCKPGAGCSTMATHLASLCAETSGRPVALFDLDLSCGALQFITEAQGGISMLEAAQHAHRIDESLWNQLIARRDGIHLMHAGCLSPSVQMDPAQLQPLLSFAASQYPTVIADLPGSHDTLSIHVAEQSTQVYMVCTPDLASLHLARRQLQFLKELGVMDRVELVVNRATCHFGLSGRAIEEILEKSPAIYVPNNYLPLQKALKERSLMSADSPYCRALSELVPRILGLPASPAARPASPGDWIVRHRLSHPLQALRAAIHSFRPAATVPPSAGEEFGPAGFEQENPEGEQASSNAGATAREAVLPEAVATEVMASLAPPPAVTAEQGPRQGKRPASHRKGKQHR
jgi:Flp pilus assembly CpaE family ATPase